MFFKHGCYANNLLWPLGGTVEHQMPNVRSYLSFTKKLASCHLSSEISTFHRITELVLEMPSLFLKIKIIVIFFLQKIVACKEAIKLSSGTVAVSQSDPYFFLFKIFFCSAIADQFFSAPIHPYKQLKNAIRMQEQPYAHFPPLLITVEYYH